MLLSLGLSHHNLVKRRNLERVSARSSKFLLFSSIGDQIIRDNAKVAYNTVSLEYTFLHSLQSSIGSGECGSFYLWTAATRICPKVRTSWNVEWTTENRILYCGSLLYWHLKCQITWRILFIVVHWTWIKTHTVKVLIQDGQVGPRFLFGFLVSYRTVRNPGIWSNTHWVWIHPPFKLRWMRFMYTWPSFHILVEGHVIQYTVIQVSIPVGIKKLVIECGNGDVVLTIS